MVSKIAVMALVGILAVPILLGYAMNLSEVTVTDYAPTGESVNVTPLLQDGVSYTYAHASAYELNTNFKSYTNPTFNNILPVYEEISSTKTTFPLSETTFTDSYPTINRPFSELSELYFQANYSTSDGYLTLRIYDSSNVLKRTIDKIYALSYDSASQKIDYYYYDGYYGMIHATYNIPSSDYVPVLSDSGTFIGTVYYAYALKTGQTDYVNLAAGYRLYDLDVYPYQYVDLPDYSKSVTATIDLSTISDSSYYMNIGSYRLDKTTVGGDVTWLVYYDNGIDPITDPLAELYYDESRTSNTYQLYIWTDLNSLVPAEGSPGYYYVDRHTEFRYVGDWPTLIGEANYYQSYDIIYNLFTSSTDPNFGSLSVKSNSGLTPVMRIDDAEYRAFEYQIMENKTYNPADFKTNPSTTLSGLQIYGTQIEFGGHVYAVRNGNITIGSREISLNGLEFNSVPSSSGSGYDNRIGKTVVSTTADPSTITFNGKWSVSVSTVSLEEKTTIKTEWTPGQFGWDGIDDNFLIVGLLTSVGMFIALGIYVRRTKASLWPLLIVCGGAAVLFFIMI